MSADPDTEARTPGTPHEALPQDRRRYILDQLRRFGSVRNTWLAERLEVNPVTIRRDLKALEAEGMLRQVRGGATSSARPTPLAADSDLPAKQRINVAAKRQIATKAQTLIRPGETIAVNSGSTAETLVAMLPKELPVTVVTLGLNVAVRVASNPSLSLVLIGGRLRETSQAFYGPDAVKILGKLRIDVGFFGATSVDVISGWTHPDPVEVEINRQLFDVCAARYLIADSSKYGLSAVWHIAELAEFDGLIVDDDHDPGLDGWAEQVKTVII